MFQFSNFDIQQQLLAFMLHNGIVPYDQNMPIITDGLIHRFRTHDDAHDDKSGTYCIYAQDCTGWVQDWRKGSRRSSAQSP